MMCEDIDRTEEGFDDLVEIEDDNDIYKETVHDKFLYDEINGEYRKQDIMKKLGQKKLTKEELDFIMIHNEE